MVGVMISTMTTRLDPKLLSARLREVMQIKDISTDPQVIHLCNMYHELCKDIADNMIDVHGGDELLDNMDRPHRHNINPANRPSLVQEKFMKEWNDDDDKTTSDNR
jgi:hypothetical protein